MTMKKILWTIIIGSCLIAADIVVDDWFPKGLLVNEAQARIGRPMTPGSVAGVARRTTRRRIRRSTIFIATLPRGCRTVVIEGATLHHCGGAYYQPSGGQYVVVYVD
jgi:hypothetical protein